MTCELTYQWADSFPDPSGPWIGKSFWSWVDPRGHFALPTMASVESLLDRPKTIPFQFLQNKFSLSSGLEKESPIHIKSQELTIIAKSLKTSILLIFRPKKLRQVVRSSEWGKSFSPARNWFLPWNSSLPLLPLGVVYLCFRAPLWAIWWAGIWTLAWIFCRGKALRGGPKAIERGSIEPICSPLYMEYLAIYPADCSICHVLTLDISLWHHFGSIFWADRAKISSDLCGGWNEREKQKRAGIAFHSRLVVICSILWTWVCAGYASRFLSRCQGPFRRFPTEPIKRGLFQS